MTGYIFEFKGPLPDMTQRDRAFVFEGVSVLVDSAVLPTLRLSFNGGVTWREGAGIRWFVTVMKCDEGSALALAGAFQKEFNVDILNT
jgi:hypothetical protein